MCNWQAEMAALYEGCDNGCDMGLLQWKNAGLRRTSLISKDVQSKLSVEQFVLIWLFFFFTFKHVLCYFKRLSCNICFQPFNDWSSNTSIIVSTNKTDDVSQNKNHPLGINYDCTLQATHRYWWLMWTHASNTNSTSSAMHLFPLTDEILKQRLRVFCYSECVSLWFPGTLQWRFSVQRELKLFQHLHQDCGASADRHMENNIIGDGSHLFLPLRRRYSVPLCGSNKHFSASQSVWNAKINVEQSEVTFLLCKICVCVLSFSKVLQCLRCTCGTMARKKHEQTFKLDATVRYH